MRNFNPTVLAMAVFYSIGLVLVGGARAQQSPQYYPPGFNAPGYPGLQKQPYRGKPLPDTVYGQPIDSTQSADAVLNYVQREVESRVRLAPGRTRSTGNNTYEIVPPTLDLSPALRDAMAPIVANFGVENLQRALKLGTQPRMVDGDMTNTVDILREYEGTIIQAALTLAQGGSTTAEDHPLAATRNPLPYSPPPPTPPVPTPAPQVEPSPAPPVVTNAAPAVVPPPAPAPAPLQTATVTAKTKIEAHTPSGGYAALPLDVGDQLTILSINNDGTVTAEAKYHFQGTVLQSNIHLNPAATP
jgi:hypothetical protein